MNKSNKQHEPLFVEIFIKVGEILKFACEGKKGTSTSRCELFRIESFYFLFTFQREGEERTRRLRQIRKKEFMEEKQRLLALRPRLGCENWKDSDNNYELKCYCNYSWKKVLPADNCTFIQDSRENINPLRLRYLQAVEDAKFADRPTSAAVTKASKQQIQQAAKLAKELGIDFKNVCAIGLDKAKLLAFKKSYEQAIANVKKMSVAEQYRLYSGLRPTHDRTTRKDTILSLGITFFEADVKRLNLCELEAVLGKTVEDYKQQSVQTAIAKGVALPHDERESLYNRMISTSRTEKRQLLTELGVDINAIELNRYSLSPIKHAIAATLGIDMEKV